MKKLKFFNLHDLLISVIPGILMIHLTIEEFASWIATILAVIVLLLFIILIIKKKYWCIQKGGC